jgi:hypothetical protein
MPKPIGKFAFNCLANLKEIQLDKLVKWFIAKNITLRECPTKERRPMYKFTRLL